MGVWLIALLVENYWNIMIDYEFPYSRCTVSWCNVHKPDSYFLAMFAEIHLINLSEHRGIMSLSVCGLIMTANVFLQ